MQEDNARIQEQVANELAKLKKQASAHEAVSGEVALEPLAHKIKKLNQGGLAEELTRTLNKLTESSTTEGAAIFDRKSKYFPLVYERMKFPVTKVAEARSQLVQSGRPWSKNWLRMRTAFGQLNKQSAGGVAILLVAFYAIGAFGSFALVIGALIESSFLIYFAGSSALAGGVLSLPIYFTKDSFVLSDISRIAIEGTDVLQQKIDDCGFESRAVVRGVSLNEVTLTIEIRYTPEAQRILTLR